MGSVISANMGSGCFRPTLANSCANHLQPQAGAVLKAAQLLKWIVKQNIVFTHSGTARQA